MYDIAVIGAGPSGATFARLVARQYRVLLVDKRDPANPNAGARAAKCCGGLLAPDAQKMLSTLGLGLPKDVLEEPQLFVVKAIDLERGLERNYQRHYINMDRRKFDAWLLSLVPPSVETRAGCRLKSVARRNEGFDLTLVVRGGETSVERARVVVGADGAHSAVRRQLFADRPTPKEYCAIQEWVEANHEFPYFTSVFDREITDYYCWTIPKGERLIIGAAVHPPREAARKFDLLKRKLKDHGFKFGRTVQREGALIFRPVRGSQIATAKERAALVGEAAGWISPSSAEGLSYAFRSALELAESMQKTLGRFERRYRAATRALRRNLFLKNLKSPFIFNPTLRRVVMRSGVHSMTIHAAPAGAEKLDERKTLR
ncbi:MAG: FAD-binding protein [Pirellulales bacterium]|nr:FAD-binding protein [Pirellulales bacterium]